MKLQTLQVIQIFIECRNIVGGASVHISKHSLFRLKITVGCRLCAYRSIRVCVVCDMCGMCRVVCVCVCVVCMCMCRVLKWLCVCAESVCGVCAESVCGMCVLCFGVAVCCAVSSCVVWVGVPVCNVWCVVCGAALFSPLPVTMTMITRPVGSLCKQSSDLPQCQSAWASVHSLFGDDVRIMQETTVLV